MSIPTAKKFLVSVVLAAFLVVGLFGLFHFAMNINDGGHVMGCPFTDMASICTMNPFAHITMWQNMFASSFPKDILYLLALAMSIVLFAFTPQGWKHNNKTPSLSVRIWHPISQTFIIKNPLQEAFSNGILHPKIF